MAKIWREPHKDSGPGEYSEPAVVIEHRTKNATLIPEEDILVRVASFTFRFSSLRQLRDCLSYYQQKTHRSSIIPEKKIIAELGLEWREQRSWELPRWFEKLPMYLLEEPKRRKVVHALTEALRLVEDGKL
jgi:hypothetical protein